MRIPILALLFFTISSSYGANILFFFGLSTYSHRITAWPLVEALVERGHTVTFLQAAENKNPNPKVHELLLHPSVSMGPMDFLDMKLKFGRMMMPILVNILPEMGHMVCNETLNDPTVMKWVNSNKVDLVVIDALYNDCAYGFAHKWGAQTVIFGTSAVFEWWGDEYGFPVESSWIANLHFGQDVPLSFLGRVMATLGHLYFRFTKIGILYPKLEKLLREKLNMPDMPSLAELNSKTSLVLMNTHFSEELARSLPPLVVPVGGMHCTDMVTPLPKEIEDFVNESGNDGFIYVSFGSEVKISAASKELRDVFFNAFRNAKTRFIWKWEGPRPKDMPPNVLTVPWVPQQSLLAHPKIRAFITHGGLLSIQEALWHPVPMISFPVFAEQDYNAERVHRTKRGIRLDITTLTQTELEQTIQKILTDDTYIKNVKKTSKIFKDRPQKPVETAVWWVEYIMRHGEDTSFLRPLAIQQHWFQRRLLDVWLFILSIIVMFNISAFYVIKELLSCCFGGRNAKSSSQKKSKVKKQ